MKCPYCGCENDDKAKICKRCFAELTHDKPKDDKTVAKKRTSKG